MIIYRPHRGSLEDAMNEKKEFNSIDDMKMFIEVNTNGLYSFKDIVLSKEKHNDDRIGWYNASYVCVNGYIDWDGAYIDFITKYGVPQCIGMCSEDYR